MNAPPRLLIRMRWWFMRQLDRFAEWILTFTRQPECPYCHEYADGTVETQPATEDDPITVRTWVCMACAHRVGA